MRAPTNPQALGITLLITGAAVWAGSWRVTRAVREVNRPADEAYRDGFDAGHDKGWREGRASSLPKVVGLRRAQ